MAELRSTDIIGKLRKINNKVQELEGIVTGELDVASAGSIVTSYVQTLTKNIEGQTSTDYTLSEKFSGGMLGSYYYKLLFKNNSVMSKANAKIFISLLTGSSFVPSLPAPLTGTPQYHYVITYKNEVYLIGFTKDRELEFHRVPLEEKASISNDINEDSDSEVLAPSVKAIKKYIDEQSAPEVQIGGNEPTESSYKIWINI